MFALFLNNLRFFKFEIRKFKNKVLQDFIFIFVYSSINKISNRNSSGMASKKAECGRKILEMNQNSSLNVFFCRVIFKREFKL